MRICGLPAVVRFAAALYGATSASGLGAGLPLDCDKTWLGHVDKACTQPIDDVVAVAPGASYIAKIECSDCAWSPHYQQTEKGKDEVVHRDQIFYLHVELAHDNRSVLLDGKPIFPLPTVPTPPKFRIRQFPSNFSNAQLLTSLTCREDLDCVGWPRLPAKCSQWCSEVNPSSFLADYLYTVEPTRVQEKDKDELASQYWEVAFDIISSARSDGSQWKFDKPEQKMLSILVAGTEIRSHAGKGGRNKPASDLFGPLGDKDKKYKYRIVDVRLQARAYTFPYRGGLTLPQKIGRFFGNDVWQIEDRRLVYHADEWDLYGKRGTLRNLFGHFIHWDLWWLFWLVSGSTVAGAVALFSLYKFGLWILEQRQLNKWDGMDDVWDRLRREPAADEQDALLIGGYRDDPDEAGSSRPQAYTDEPPLNKPLPDKPLPDKPLPAVPLIDA